MQSPNLVYNLTQPQPLEHNPCAHAGRLPCPLPFSGRGQDSSNKPQQRATQIGPTRVSQVMHSNQDRGALAAQGGMQQTPAPHQAAICLVMRQHL